MIQDHAWARLLSECPADPLTLLLCSVVSAFALITPILASAQSAASSQRASVFDEVVVTGLLVPSVI
jgi:hypothetical protein